MKDLLGYIKKVLVFLVPFFVLLAAYIVIDPFMVIFKYKDFNRRSCIPKNRDYVSSEVYMMNRETEKYNSFIFGSSTALFVRPSTWMSYLPDKAKVFSFDASRENIIGIWSKIKYIDHMNDPIENAVFVIDYNYAFDKLDMENVLFVKHPRIFHSSWYKFQYKNLLKIFDISLIRSLVVYGLTKEFKPYMGSVIEAETAFQAIHVLTTARPNLILMDINMPDMDGYTLTGKLKANPDTANIPVIAITANVMRGDRERTLQAGCDGYIEKPIDVDRFLDQVASFLAS